MTTIICPIRYRADLTRVCIDSILNYTKDFELILVQEGTDKEITNLCEYYANYLNKGLKPGADKRIANFIRNDIPKGYAGAMNTGLKLADPNTDYYCFLNNDTVVTPGWMDEMLKLFENPEVGLVSPTFSGCNTRQSVEWNTGRESEYIYDPLGLIGVCFLIPKAVIDKVGGYDENFGLGGEEDYDMSIRISNAGYLLAIARKSYIYHYWGASFKEVFDNDMEKGMAHARHQFELLEKKHNLKLI